MLRNVTLSLGAVGCLGVVVLGGRAIEGRSAANAATRDPVPAATAPAAPSNGRLWYGGTLAPIVVEVPAPVAKAAVARPCASVGT
jgi:hypothetical protein